MDVFGYLIMLQRQFWPLDLHHILHLAIMPHEAVIRHLLALSFMFSPSHLPISLSLACILSSRDMSVPSRHCRYQNKISSSDAPS
jgi:hypothetical protein